MEFSARSYNTNGSNRVAPFAAQEGKRSAMAAPRKTTPAATAKRPRSKAPGAEPRPAAGQIAAAVALEARVVDTPEGEAEHEEQNEAEAAPVVGLAVFEEIFTRFQTPLTNFVYRLVGNREQALDLTQDVFVKAYRALASGTTIQAAALSS